ncbi:P-loop containing nucleoside triphosphate hydrolase protein, partial [Melanogaster broomeanus]
MDSVTDTIVQGIRCAALDLLNQTARELIQDRLPTEYLSTLTDNEKVDALRACLIIWILTRGTVVPRVFQLQASLAMLQQRDSVIIAGTGAGKTLCLLIPMLLRPGSISITISPLKRLQTSQVLECQKYAISTVAINEDTPDDRELWESIRTGKYQHLIVSPEQLGMCNGHLPRFGRLIRQDRSFTCKIHRVHVDEAHNIYTAGLSHHGEEAFRPAYGKLGEFRVLLPKGTPFQALSATLPPHILAVVKKELMITPNYLELRLSTNRPNITYATVTLVGSLRNFRNLDFLVPPVFHPPMTIPKTLVFHDCKQDATDAATYTDDRLPQNIRNRGIVKHYHSDMSAEYLQMTFEDFSADDGTCRIPHATAGASTVSTRPRHPGVLVVIQYGICKNVAETVQRAGRAVRDPGLNGLYLAMVEPWVLELPASLGDDDSDANDPDRPWAGAVKKNSSKQDRTGLAAIGFIQSRTCLRQYLAKYLDDQSPGALLYTALWCCDRH